MLFAFVNELILILLLCFFRFFLKINIVLLSVLSFFFFNMSVLSSLLASCCGGVELELALFI